MALKIEDSLAGVDEILEAQKEASLPCNIEPDEETKQRWLPVSLTTVVKGEEAYVGYMNVSKKSKLYTTVYDLVIVKYPTEFWTVKKEKIVKSIEKYLTQKGFTIALIDSVSDEEKKELREELEDFID